MSDGDHRPPMTPKEIADSETPPCPAWADGQHCYEIIGQPRYKACACGKTVERQ